MNFDFRKGSCIFFAVITAWLLLACWPSAVPAFSANCPDGDLVLDCKVDIYDLLKFANSWLNSDFSFDMLNGKGNDLFGYSVVANNWLETGENIRSAPIRGADWIYDACIYQPWSTQACTSLLDPAAPAQFAQRFGTNVLLVAPQPVLALQSSEAPTEAEFIAGINNFRAAGYKIMIYSSITNCGLAPEYGGGVLEAVYPDYFQVGDNNAIAPLPGWKHGYICPSGPGLDYTINYAKQLVSKYNADGIMLDNNTFLWGFGENSPRCYCQYCQAKFREYVEARFGGEVQNLFGINNISIPSTPGALYDVWKHWRNRQWAIALERFRAETGVMITANAQFIFNGWEVAVDKQYKHEDAVLSESNNQDSYWMSGKMVIANALADDRPYWNQIGLWTNADLELMKQPLEIKKITAATIAHQSNPFLHYLYSFDTVGENAASIQALEDVLKFKKANPSFYASELRPWGTVGAIKSPETFNYFGGPIYPYIMQSLRDSGIALKGLYAPYLNELDLNEFRIIAAENIKCIGESQAIALTEWIKQGGTLVTTSDFGKYSDINEPRSIWALAPYIPTTSQLKTMTVGNGRIIVDVNTSAMKRTILANTDEEFTAVNTGGSFVEVRPYGCTDANTIILHVLNHGNSITQSWQLEVPAFFARYPKIKVYQPGQTAAGAQITGNSISMPPVEYYCVIEMSNKTVHCNVDYQRASDPVFSGNAVLGGSYWNNVSIKSSFVGLKDILGNSTAVQAKVLGVGFTSCTGFNSNLADDLLNDYIYSSGGTLTIAGLTPGTSYKIVVFSNMGKQDEDLTLPPSTQWTFGSNVKVISGMSGTDQGPFYDMSHKGLSWEEFIIQADLSGNITGTFKPATGSSQTYGFLNGFQLREILPGQ